MPDVVTETSLPAMIASNDVSTVAVSLAEGWPIVPLCDVAEIRGESVDPRERPDLRYVGLEHLDPGVSQIRRWGTPETVRSQKSIFRPGDVLYGKLRPYLDKAAVASFEGMCSTDILVLVPREVMDSEFLGYYVHSHPFISHAVSTTTGVNHPRTSWHALKKAMVPLPSLPEQRAIAHVLRTVQQAKEATEAVIAATRELKKSLMRHLFTYGPVPVDQADQVVLKETEIGLVPENWTITTLGDVATIASGGTPSRSVNEYWNGTIPWVKTGEIDYRMISSTGELITERGLRESSARVFPAGTLLMAMYGQGVTRGRVGILGLDAAINQACAAITPDSRASTRCLYHLFTFQYERIRNLGHGAHQKNLSALLLKSVKIPLPPILDQGRIVDAVDAVDHKLQVEDSRRLALAALFQSLLHNLMTGKARVHDVEPVLEGVG